MDSAASHRLGAGDAHHRALLAGMHGAAAHRLGAFGADGRATLAGSLEIFDGRLAGFTDAVATVLAPHEDRRAHVVAPFKAIVAFAPAEHAASGSMLCK